ncbi:restriction endonuclease [Nocardiopsis ganjiahuensis]|uniref:restriction endonuclease n=1 Tax=Nocardiopsis ganjiahuensis TaxID=239984 RepID=UPI00034D7941|nr:restriction endonuclease [Nocardiopsis ganjiahuensis]
MLPLTVVALFVGLGWLYENADRPLVWLFVALVSVVAAAVLGWWAWSRIRRARERWIVSRTGIAGIDTMSGTEFEEHVARLLRTHGYTRVAVVGGASDGGVDVRAQTPCGRPLAVQCKRWRKPVPPNEVRAFLGALAGSHRGYVGMFVASNGFTREAVREAGDGMVLVDRHDLGLWMAGERAPELPPL